MLTYQNFTLQDIDGIKYAEYRNDPVMVVIDPRGFGQFAAQIYDTRISDGVAQKEKKFATLEECLEWINKELTTQK